MARALTLAIGTASEWPDATNTGVPAGTSLTADSGAKTLATPGQVYEDKLLTGTIDVTASNVIIRRCKIVMTGTPGITTGTNTVLIEDCEIDCGNAQRTAVDGTNWTMRRVNAYKGENIIAPQAGGSWVMEDCYVHHPIDYIPATDPHTDCVQCFGGNGTVSHCTLLGNFVRPPGTLSPEDPGDFGNSAITFGAGISNLTITNCKLGGGGQIIACFQANGTGLAVTGCRFTNEACAEAGYPDHYSGFGGGVSDGREHIQTWSDNEYLDGPLQGQVIP